MTLGIWILGDQLWTEQAALQSCVHSGDAPGQSAAAVLLIESGQYVRERPYHRQKLVLVWSAMRHFAETLRQAGWAVSYERAEAFEPALRQWILTHHITELRVMEPNDRPFAQFLRSLDLPCPLVLLPNNHFLWTASEFSTWASGRKNLRMEYFYRAGRQRYGVLMQGSQPVGGQWNFDQENRKPPSGRLNAPPPLWFEPDAMTQQTIEDVKSGGYCYSADKTADGIADETAYGSVEPFRWGVTRQQALQVLAHFIQYGLPTFGPYQDAMLTGEDTLWHALLSPYLNLGLLHPLEVIRAAEQAYWENQLDLPGVEGFIRQILGWREYMHGLYTYVAEDYPQHNWFNHTHPLPEFFWDASQTSMNCLHQVLSQIERTGYAHHIQRLMILSNFALISGIYPQAIEQWFHAALIDAYDWVMQPNVIGMGQFADGGLLASKPYAASANYIHKMSDYCKGCRYRPTVRTGEQACPFNFFYWDFLDRHRAKLATQGRMSFMLKHLDRMSPEELQQIRAQAAQWHRQQPEAL